MASSYYPHNSSTSLRCVASSMTTGQEPTLSKPGLTDLSNIVQEGKFVIYMDLGSVWRSIFGLSSQLANLYSTNHHSQYILIAYCQSTSCLENNPFSQPNLVFTPSVSVPPPNLRVNYSRDCSLRHFLDTLIAKTEFKFAKQSERSY